MRFVLFLQFMNNIFLFEIMRFLLFLQLLKMQKSNCYSTKLIRYNIIVFIILFFAYNCLTYKKEDLLANPYPPAVINFNTSSRYLSSNLASVCQLGNNIFELASLYGLSKYLNRTPVFFIENGYHERMLNKMRSIMPGLMEKFVIINGSVPLSINYTKFQRVCCVHEDPWNLKRSSDKYLHLSGIFYQSWKYFPKVKNELASFLNNSSQNFGNLPISTNKTHITCIHTRRGDFLGYGYHATDSKFLKNSVKFLKENDKNSKKNRKIVLFGDDLKFLKNKFNTAIVSTDGPEDGEYFISQNSALDDLLYSKYNCDTVLITAPHSTFGWWIGYFSKGDTVYYMDIKYSRDHIYDAGKLVENDFYPTHWTPLKFASSDNFTVVESLRSN
ncbi:L-Fucosyltransferase [Caenorhabditis elegans]|uniref:L-Fucosyltransferase n=1 Tax=Caenorhabditis elegans TaxID=6239 RepID=O17127_CAEEL|nr:L-Fucosyltransferase [Caenorhabditis elegans]CCD70342.2 L-Fucosyltransferase [Caenorhabditis elegans]|eukprot:NP_503283.2 Uncharacterized protein CELE_F31F4.17 [Caenorhabditis elegans]